jgi:uncharacterized membrane protein YdjX (TVP38/TMEM64 family)
MTSISMINENSFYRIPKGDSKKRFIKFILLIIFGLVTSYLFFRRGTSLTPELLQNYVLSMGLLGPLLYATLFIVRPLLLIPSIWLFIGGGLAFGSLWGPVYASLGASLGGALAFWIARIMGQDYVSGQLKTGGASLKNKKFNFFVVFILSLIPIMPVTVINYGAGLSSMKFKSYFIAHVLGITPRAFAYGFLGSTLLDMGSPEFRTACLILILMSMVAIYMKLRSKKNEGHANRVVDTNVDSREQISSGQFFPNQILSKLLQAREKQSMNSLQCKVHP